MASIRIKTDSLDIKINDVSPDEFNGAWKWVVDIVGQFYDREIESDEWDNFKSFGGALIRTIAHNVIANMYGDMIKKEYLKDIQHYNVHLLGKIPFEVICDRLLDNRQFYPPEEAAKLTGKIVAQFFYEQSKKGTPIR